jgi:alkylhydroperoxidase family enzyme
VDAHSAMAMAQGFSREDVKNILADIDNTTLIDDKTRKLLQLAGKITRHAYKVTEDDIDALHDIGCTDEEIFEAVVVSSLFNYMDRIADAFGAPFEGFQDMVEQMMQG